MFVILVLIILVASFNIVSTLIMNVIEKKREIAILKTMGATDRSIMSIFMLQGLLIGLVGTTIGVTGGYLLCYVLNTYEIIKLPADVYYLSHLPVKTKFSDFLTVSLPRYISRPLTHVAAKMTRYAAGNRQMFKLKKSQVSVIPLSFSWPFAVAGSLQMVRTQSRMGSSEAEEAKS
jgi:ABC-type antimicrobial peptide transport system permease subunit